MAPLNELRGLLRALMKEMLFATKFWLPAGLSDQGVNTSCHVNTSCNAHPVPPLGEEGDDVGAAARHAEDDLGGAAAAPRPLLGRREQLRAEAAPLEVRVHRQLADLQARLARHYRDAADDLP